MTSPRITLRQYRRARASKLKNRRARAKLKTTHMLRNSKRISQGRTLRPKPGSDAWDPLQKSAFRPNLPLPFLLTLSGHNSPPDVAREEHPWRLPRIAVMPRRHGDTRFDGMIRSVDTGQLVKDGTGPTLRGHSMAGGGAYHDHSMPLRSPLARKKIQIYRPRHHTTAHYATTRAREVP